MSDDFDPVTYRDVNDAWGGIHLPAITALESLVIAHRLVVKFGGRAMGLPWYFRRVNRSWAAPGGCNTAYGPHPINGLPRMVHDVSHWVHRCLHHKAKDHCAPHAALEKAMIEHVIAKGLYLRKAKSVPKPKPTKDELRVVELARTEASMKRWLTKQRRAATALKKLAAKKRRLERTINDRRPEARGHGVAAEASA